MSKIISKQRKVDIVFQLAEEIQNAKKETVKSFLTIGRNLDKIQREKLWRYYGSHLQNFNDFVQEISFKHATAYNCIRIWRVFGLMYKDLYLDNIDYFKLVRLLPIVKELDEDEKKNWLDKANTLPSQGFNDEIREAKGLKTTDTCQHPLEERTYYYRCGVCNKWVQISKEAICSQK